MMREIGLVALLCLLAMVGCTAREEEPEAATPEVGTAAAQPATAEAAATSTKELKGTIVRGVCEAPRPPAKGTEGGVAPANVQDSEGGALSTGYGQVTLVNRTSVTLDLYVSGSYGCRALKGLMCTTQVKAGTHTLEAKASDGRSTSTSVTLNAGDSFTWTVTEE